MSTASRRQLFSQLTRSSHRTASLRALTRRCSGVSSSAGGSSAGGSSAGGNSSAAKQPGSLEEFYFAEANLIAKGVQLITSFRRWGHLAARTDPLGLAGPTPDAPTASLRLESYNFTAAQLSSERPMDVSGAVFGASGCHGFSASERSLPLRALHRRLGEVYAGAQLVRE